MFMYGNYDSKMALPAFDIYVGVNYWSTIVIPDSDGAYFNEIITTTTSDYLQVCLINTDRGTPFISALELRQMETTLYKDANATQSLVWFKRFNMGAEDFLRYPDDPYDRIWTDYTGRWPSISTNSTVKPDTAFATPSLDIPRTGYREFDILADGFPMYDDHIVPQKLTSGWAAYLDTDATTYNVTLKPTSNSTLPPLLNAIEIYYIRPATGIPSYSGDVTAINKIKANYKVNKGWSGDPCVPTEYTWTGVTCTSDSNNIPRITSLDLSYNKLSGNLPTFLDQLSALTYLDVTGNSHLSTTLPSGLQKRNQDGKLTFRYDAPFAASPSNNNKKKTSPAIIAVAGVVVLLLIAGVIMTILCLKRRKYGDYMALVYEYMQEGTLQDKLTDNARPLTWKQRVRIAYESALGLEYLHKACNPPLIHRDVKTNNILLNVNLEAKIADFGLSRAFNNDVSSHVSTAIVGTPGYLDPEYYSSCQLSKKSDVFSFGVVLLEIITGQPPIIGGPESGHVTHWVTDLARKCADNNSANRPTMNAVVMELKESLDLENSTEEIRSGSTTNTYPHNYSRNNNFVSDVSQNSAFEMSYMSGPAPGPTAR
ncbi:hypothetical protein LUZ61_021122 [Rhynchospora tenuis]|uniref:Protein kinase domain-containing protein n=1 Tax=Rhynchospora tenuis TaxID=198213 RepID=A0AAD5WB80_9POAL|nr:hypothetical protein LUZ61_021122 [Rhynchospora tenuis]